MLPTIHRLARKKDFDQVFVQGKSVKSGFLLCKTLKTGLKESRFGFVVSKKVSSKATVRNKVKRKLRAALREYLPKLPPSTDVMIIALPDARDKEFVEIKRVVRELFIKAGLLTQ